jgi:hypothetical protein
MYEPSHVLLSDIVVFFLAKEIFRYRAENIYIYTVVLTGEYFEIHTEGYF